jgi:hypothetical protein
MNRKSESNEVTAMRSHAIPLFLGSLLVLAGALAGIPEPDHIFYGIAPDASGTISVTIGDDADPADSFVIGSRPDLGERYVLRVPMDTVGPRTPGFARTGDPAEFRLNGVPVATEMVGQPGAVQQFDLPDATDEIGIRIEDVSVAEGDAGATDAVFQLRLFPAAEAAVSVRYTIEAGTASPGADFLLPGRPETSGLVRFDPGMTSHSITVKVVGDEETEGDETFQVVLSQASGAPIARDRATGTILDDDFVVPTVSIADAHVVEGSDAIVEVELSPVADTAVTVHYTTVSAVAKAVDDFTAQSGTLVFEAGERFTSIRVETIDDDDAETIESFTVRLTSVSNAEMGDDEARVTILDDDSSVGPIVGSVTASADPVSVQLDYALDDPVVILGPPTDDGPGIVLASLEAIEEQGFAVRLRNPDGRPILRPETLDYLVLDPGVHVLDDGSIWEAGVFEVQTAGQWTVQQFSAPFAGTPELLLTLQDGSGATPAAVRARSVTTGGFQAALFGWSPRIDEGARRVGYLAIHSPQGSGVVRSGETLLPYVLQKPRVDEKNTPVLSWSLRLQRGVTALRPGRSLSRTRVSRTSVPAEPLSLLALGNHLFAQDVGAARGGPLAMRLTPPGEDATLEWGTATSIGNGWMTIPLAREYVRPIVVAKPILEPGAVPVSIALRNVVTDSFEVRALPWTSASTSAFRVTYLVVERGEHSLAGLRLRAGSLETDVRLGQGWQGVPYGARFEQVPVVLAGLQTDPGEAGMLVRIHNRGEEQFDLSLQDGPGGTAAGAQSVGWIAIESGGADTADGRHVLAHSELLTSVDRGPRSEIRTRAKSLAVTVGDTGSTYDPAASFVCYQTFGSSSGVFLLLDPPRDDHAGVAEDGCFFTAE